MINAKKLILMARKWQKLAVMNRKRISLAWKNDSKDRVGASLKGHFAVYTADKRRFVIPLVCLNNEIFIKLLKLSEEEFGLSSDGPIKLPCDAIFIEYLIMLIQRGAATSLEKVLLTSIASSPCSSSSSSSSLFLEKQMDQHLLICSH